MYLSRISIHRADSRQHTSGTGRYRKSWRQTLTLIFTPRDSKVLHPFLNHRPLKPAIIIFSPACLSNLFGVHIWAQLSRIVVKFGNEFSHRQITTVCPAMPKNAFKNENYRYFTDMKHWPFEICNKNKPYRLG